MIASKGETKGKGKREWGKRKRLSMAKSASSLFLSMIMIATKPSYAHPLAHTKNIRALAAAIG